jgi:uncharacterized protein YcaQ
LDHLQISQRTHRRFVLGRQGLWPGRRWRGIEGTADALTECEALQLDPLTVVARSHDIALYGRVIDYTPDHLDELCYQQRRFFDYGGSLFVYPAHELPYWRCHMQRHGNSDRWVKFQKDHPEAVAYVRQALRENGPLGNRDLKGNRKLTSYRGTKDTSVALYYLWLLGEAMVHHRQNFQRIYDLRSRVAPPELDFQASAEESGSFFARKAIAFRGLVRLTDWKNGFSSFINRKISVPDAQTRMQRMVSDGLAVPVSIAGQKEVHYALPEDVSILQEIETGGVPESWRPLDTSTDEEVTFLAPLEICSARGRAKKLFGFDYVWEVYKPVAQRQWGYYVLPILYGDSLVGRADLRLERDDMTLHILGFWLEEDSLGENTVFSAAFNRGLQRFMRFLDAQAVELPEAFPAGLRRSLDF